MVPIKRVDKITHLADIATKTEAALGELHHYYKVGRHLGAFPQKLYFLFSHCSHLLFSLWLTEQQAHTGILTESPSLAALVDKLDFDGLRYIDYSRRMLYADAYEEHLKNEPKWFRFWTQLLQELQASDAAGIEKFSGQFSACLSDCSFLEGKLSQRDQKVLANLVQCSRAGRLLLHSTWVLEDIILAACAHIAKLDPTDHAIERMQLVTCLLSQLRRTILWGAAAEGPYTLSAGGDWDIPSKLNRFFHNSITGLLTITLQEEGGEVACVFTRPSDGKPNERTWVRSLSVLQSEYEEALFKTWPQSDQEQTAGTELQAQSQAHWTIHAVEAGQLEATARHIDTLLEAFASRPAYEAFIGSIGKIVRNDRSEWTAGRLSWGYVKTLDQLFSKLKFACREAKVLGGRNPAESVVANLWPSQQASAPETNTMTPAMPAPQQAVEETPSAPSHEVPEDSPTESCEETTDEQATSESFAPASEQAPTDQQPAVDPVVCEDGPTTSTPSEPESVPIEYSWQPERPEWVTDTGPSDKEHRHDPQKQQMDRLAQTINMLIGEVIQPYNASPAKPAGGNRSEERHLTDSPPECHAAVDPATWPAARILVRRLLQRHALSTKGSDNAPMSPAQLQQDLGWPRSKVQHTMNEVFGDRPFEVYKNRCVDGSIRSFLEDSSRLSGVEVDSAESWVPAGQDCPPPSGDQDRAVCLNTGCSIDG